MLSAVYHVFVPKYVVHQKRVFNYIAFVVSFKVLPTLKWV